MDPSLYESFSRSFPGIDPSALRRGPLCRCSAMHFVDPRKGMDMMYTYTRSTGSWRYERNTLGSVGLEVYSSLSME